MVKPWTDLIPIPETMPETTRCVQVVIPDGIEYVSMLFRALGWLANWTTYQRDTAHTGAQIAELWKQAIAASLPEVGCGGMLEDVRQKDGEPCILEKKLSGEWQPFANLRYCPPNLRLNDGVLQYYDENTETWVDYPAYGTAPGTQPGTQPGGDQPVPYNECNSIRLTVQGNGITIVPFRVMPGDTITIEDIDGGWTNNFGVAPLTQWTCGNGKVYALGACGTQDGSTTGALIAGKPAGKLICQYGSNYFDPIAAPFQIPYGWTEDMLVLRMNDSDPSDNAGSVSALVTVCSGQWCFEFDFTTGQHGWAPYGSISCDYVAGVGFVDHFVTGWHAANIDYDMPQSGSITRFEIHGSVTVGSGNGYDPLNLDPWQRTAWWQGDAGAINGTQLWPNWSSPMINQGFLTVNTRLEVGLIASQSPGGSNLGGTCTITKIVIRGTGECPFGDPNCP